MDIHMKKLTKPRNLNAPYGQYLRWWSRGYLKEVKMLIRPKEEMKK